jgi:hypothetical protein
VNAAGTDSFRLKKLGFSMGRMVLLDRIELSTSPLPRECSTTELQQRRAGTHGAS